MDNKGKHINFGVVFIACLMVLAIISSINTANKNSTKEKEQDITKVYRSIDKKDITEDLMEVIQSGDTAESTYCIGNFDMDDEDVLADAVLNKSYMSDSAVYLQVESGSTANKNYMYRFQMDTDTDVVVSYIKYTLEH